MTRTNYLHTNSPSNMSNYLSRTKHTVLFYTERFTFSLIYTYITNHVNDVCNLWGYLVQTTSS